MPNITDDFMRSMLAKAKQYSIVILHGTEKLADPASRPIVWEHGRRNFHLREQGVLAIVCPVTDQSPLSGVGIFNTSIEETRRIMDGDPGVQAGVFTFEVHPCRGFPGDALP